MIKLRHGLLMGLGLIWWLTKPERRDDAMSDWQGDFSHRGLHDPAAPENTEAAFQKSIEQGLGFEFDVQLTKDDQLVIHHDFDGRRSFASADRIDQLTLEKLRQKRLFQTDETIMTLEELLELSAGRVRLILEIKTEKRASHIARLVAERLDEYPGEVVIESFHPLVLWWFRRHRPEMIRGQLSYNSFKAAPSVRNFLLSHYLFNALARPHFVAHAFEDRHDCGLRLQRWLHRTPLVVYTIKNPTDYRTAKAIFSTIIFEDFLPEE
ncbi:MAG TPA: glycerophosphodiester phosphodiesterase [Tissierellia bacterium]|nr:glycerophosphodiester phosphodiesterase [Tissierellia bacterium]